MRNLYSNLIAIYFVVCAIKTTILFFYFRLHFIITFNVIRQIVLLLIIYQDFVEKKVQWLMPFNFFFQTISAFVKNYRKCHVIFTCLLRNVLNIFLYISLQSQTLKLKINLWNQFFNSKFSQELYQVLNIQDLRICFEYLTILS